eukprot:2595722-Pyramimonas_sp.AAC.1
MVFLEGSTYQELAEEIGENERAVCFPLPPGGSATVLRTLPGFEHYDESKHCLQCLDPGTGTKDAPRAFSLKLRRTTRFWSQTHVIRRGVREKQQPAHGRTC